MGPVSLAREGISLGETPWPGFESRPGYHLTLPAVVDAVRPDIV